MYEHASLVYVIFIASCTFLELFLDLIRACVCKVFLSSEITLAKLLCVPIMACPVFRLIQGLGKESNLFSFNSYDFQNFLLKKEVKNL